MYVLKGIVPEDVYKHFLCLSVSISILLYFHLSDVDYMELFQFTKGLLKWFVQASSRIYGDTFVSLNVHSLIHLPDDVEHFNCGLERISAFDFENFMQRIKKMVRKSHQILPQVVRR